MDLDAMVGRDFEQGLADLDAAARARAHGRATGAVDLASPRASLR
jgi:hypothetical protein